MSSRLCQHPVSWCSERDINGLRHGVRRQRERALWWTQSSQLILERTNPASGPHYRAERREMGFPWMLFVSIIFLFSLNKFRVRVLEP